MHTLWHDMRAQRLKRLLSPLVPSMNTAYPTLDTTPVCGETRNSHLQPFTRNQHLRSAPQQEHH